MPLCPVLSLWCTAVVLYGWWITCRAHLYQCWVPMVRGLVITKVDIWMLWLTYPSIIQMHCITLRVIFTRYLCVCVCVYKYIHNMHIYTYTDMKLWKIRLYFLFDSPPCFLLSMEQVYIFPHKGLNKVILCLPCILLTELTRCRPVHKSQSVFVRINSGD